MPSDVRPIVVDLGRRLQSELPALTEELTEHFVRLIPEFRHDEAVRQLMVASTSSNLVTVFDILAHGIALDRIHVPPAAAEYARRFAQRGLSLEALLRAYRLGEHRVLRWVLRYLGSLELDVATIVATGDLVAVTVNRYIDQVVESLIDIYEQERQRWVTRSDATRAAQLRTVLTTDTLDLASAEELLGISLRGWHLAVVAWVDTGVADPGQHLWAMTRLLREVTGREPLTMLADDHTLWAWFASAGRIEIDTEPLTARLAETPARHLALGELESGLAGFRSSHRAALRARAVAEAAPGVVPPVTRFADVAIAALMADSRDDLRGWVIRTLGGLARDDEATARLRDTVRIFLQCGGSYTDAAARLHMHKNTVNYRARKAEELLGHPLGEHRLDVEVALLVADRLGTRIVGPA